VHRGRFQKYNGAWCAECFTSHELDAFEVKLPRDFYGASLAAELEDLKRFKQARPGDLSAMSFSVLFVSPKTSEGKTWIQMMRRLMPLKCWLFVPFWTLSGLMH
jgi:hypothetical protein